MSLRNAVRRSFNERYLKPKRVGIVGISPATREEARNRLTGLNPDLPSVVELLENEAHLESDPGAMRTLAVARLYLRQPADAVALLKEAERVLLDEQAINYATQAMCFIDLRQLEDAVDCGRRAVATCPSQFMGHVNLGAALIEQGNLEAAFQVLVDMTRTWPEGTSDEDLRARILREDGQWAHLRASPDYSARLAALFPNVDEE